VLEEICRAIESDDNFAGRFELVKSVAVRGQGLRMIFGLAG